MRMGSMTYFSARSRGRVANLVAYRCDMGLRTGISDDAFYTAGTQFSTDATERALAPHPMRVMSMETGLRTYCFLCRV